MTRIKQPSLFMFLCLGAVLSLTASAQDESIVLDLDTGNYIITFRSTFPSRELHQVVFIPATKIDPAVKSKFKLTREQNISYEYKVINGPNSKQPLIGLRLIVSRADKSSQVAPKGWYASVIQNIADTRTGINWTYEELKKDASAGLQPGQNQNGFIIESPDLPGVDSMRLRGAAPVFGVPDEGPGMDSEVGKKLNELKRSNFVPRLVAIPRISSPVPFNAVVVLGGMQKHVMDDMASMQLIDPVLLALIDRGLTQAIAAAQGGNTPSLLHEIKRLRKLLKQEHADVDKDDDWDDDDKSKTTKRQIDKLAARVLDFDLKYIERRVKNDKD